MLRRSPRRFVAGAVALILASVPLVAASSAFGDPISDKRSEAQQVANELEGLQEQAEILAEQYNDARLALAEVQKKVAAVKDRVEKTNAELDARRSDVAGYAVNAYMYGGREASATDLLASEDGNEVGRREGYTSAAIGDREDLLDRMRVAQAESRAETNSLHKAQDAAATAEAAVDAKRKAAQSKVDEQQKVLDKVRGELARLVEAEQQRRAAAAAKRARDAARRAAAQRPSNPTVDQPSSPGSGSGGSSGPTVGPPSTPEPPVGEGAGAAIAAAQSVLGVRYTWGGASPSAGFDCSGLTMWAWAHGGKSLPHSSAAQYSMSRRIPMSSLQPGDLVFYGSPVHHVALYIGGGQIIHAPHTGSYVQVASVYYWSDVAGAGRI